MRVSQFFSSGVKHIIKNVTFICAFIFVLTALFSVPVFANIYVPNTLTDPVITTLNNATGAINGGATISLRSALTAADNLGGTHTVTLSTGTYNLTQAIPNRQITIGNTAQNITINGNGPTNTIISNTLDANKDRILFINPAGTTNNVITNVSGIRFQNAFLSSDLFGGAAIDAGGGTGNALTVTNSTFDNNVIPANAFGGAAVCMQVSGNLTIDNSTFTNNVSNDADGGAVFFIIFSGAGRSGVLNVTNSTFTNNSVVFPAAGTANGGALAFTGQGGIVGSFNATITRNTFINNTADGLGGAISANNSPNLSIPQIHFNRFIGNTGAAGAASNALHFVESSGSVNADSNWWGCNTGPAASPCDRAGGDVAGGGALTTSPWLQLRHSASPLTIAVGGTSTLTADILGLSTGGSTAAANLTGLAAFPSPAATIFSSPVNGTLSAASTQFINGQATATFTATTIGTGTTNATADTQTQPLATGITITPTSTSSAPGCTGLAPSPLVAGSTNRAILCFTLTSNAAVNFTALNVPFTTAPNTRFTTAQLYRSTDNSYATAGDNTLVSAGTINATQFTFTGFTAFSGIEPVIPELSASPTNFFVVANIAAGVTPATPNSQPSVAPANMTVASGNVTGATVTGTNYAFQLATAASVSVSGRVFSSSGSGVANATVVMSDQSGMNRYARTNTFGYYRFHDVQVGETYIFSVTSKRYQFSPQVFSIVEDVGDLNFVAQ